jgi:hypothetical protein
MERKIQFLMSLAVVLVAGGKALALGNEGSGGGSGAAAEFADLGYNAAKAIVNLPGFPVSGDQLQAAVASTHVEFVDHSLRDPQGLEVDALNFPSKSLVQVNLGRWQGMLFSAVSKYQLAVHEYLGILKIDDSGYKVSQLVLSGGTKINSMVCTYALSAAGQGVLTWYVIDTTGAGHPDKSEAQFSLRSTDGSINMQAPVSVGMSARSKEMGYSLAWSDVVQETAFIPYDQFSTPGTFAEPYFSNAGFDQNGAPKSNLAGTLNCTVQTN